MELRTYGIRHHGPGSARRLRTALEEFQPDLILLEAPADSTPALLQLVAEGMRPPLALVLYEARQIERASFYPFARFSPEYQALDWAREAGVEVRPIDLPAKHYLALRQEGIPQEELPARLHKLRRDPLAKVAELAGYDDSESWWDATLERGRRGAGAVFSGILEIITELRSAYPETSTEENEQREAFMRLEIRKARKSGAERIAIVVGAFHAPAVNDPAHYKVSTDRARLKGLPKVKVSHAWVPWSFPRLAREGGYGAGVTSPAWYALLFDYPDQAVDRYMATAGQYLRAAGFDASPAMATEAVGLARTLATLRDHEIPGIAELEQALLGTLAAGMPERLQLIHDSLTVGERVGHVPPGVTTVPLFADLRAEIKSTRLSKFWEVTGEHYLKATRANPRGGIDLRQPNDLRKSHLLHRLNLLDIPWGRLQPEGPDSLGSFREIWLLQWQPEFSLTIIERGSYGNTLAAAARAYVAERAGELRGVKPLAELILACLRAAIPEIVPQLLDHLRARAAETTNVPALLAALPALVRTSRYGDTRKTDTTALVLVIEELLPRLAAGLPAAATHIDGEQGEELVHLLSAANYYLAQFDHPILDDVWLTGLERTAAAGVDPAVEGYCLRLLYDRERITAAEAARRFSRALSRANGAGAVAGWIGGFLYGSGQLLLHFPPLFRLIDEWVAGLAWADFEQVVPLLRRSFADFSRYDRRKLMELVSGTEATTDRGSEKRATRVEDPLVEDLLSWI